MVEILSAGAPGVATYNCNYLLMKRRDDVRCMRAMCLVITRSRPLHPLASEIVLSRSTQYIRGVGRPICDVSSISPRCGSSGSHHAMLTVHGEPCVESTGDVF